MTKRTLNIVADYAPRGPNAYMLPAWASCLQWAAGQPKILDAFRRDTGITWKPAETVIDQMIDEAAGLPEKVAERFAEWFNENIWGKDCL